MHCLKAFFLGLQEIWNKAADFGSLAGGGCQSEAQMEVFGEAKAAWSFCSFLKTIRRIRFLALEMA